VKPSTAKAAGFTYTFEVPSQTAVGDTAVTAIPYDIDWVR
jgi:hypothetical protein